MTEIVSRISAWIGRVRKPLPPHIKELIGLLLQQPPGALIHDRLRTLNERLQISEAENFSLREWRGKLLELFPVEAAPSEQLKQLLERDPLFHAGRLDPLLREHEIQASEREAARARAGVKSDLGDSLNAIRDEGRLPRS